MKTKYSHLFIALVTLLSAMTIHSCGENEIIVPNKTEEDTKLEIDSVSSHFKFEYTYNDDVIELTDEQISYLEPEENRTIIYPEKIFFKPNTPSSIIPKVGTIIVVPENEIFPFGYMGHVKMVNIDANQISIDVSNAELEEVFKYLDVDIQLNAEQLRNKKIGSCFVGESKGQASDYNDFFDGSPSCKNYLDYSTTGTNTPDNYNIKKMSTTNGADLDDFDNKKWYDIGNVNISQDGIATMSISYAFENKKTPFTFTPSGYIKFIPKSAVFKTLIEDSKIKLNTYKEYIGLEFGATAHIVASFDKRKFKKNGNVYPYGFNEASADILSRQFHRFYLVSLPPLPPIPIMLHSMIGAGVFGSISSDIEIFDRQYICISSSEVDDSLSVLKDNFVDLSLNTGLQVRWKKLSLDGGVYLKGIFAVSPCGLSVAASLKPKIQIAGNVDITDRFLFQKNPKIAVDFSCCIGVYNMVNPYDFTREGFGIWGDLPPLNIAEFPVFPQLENISGIRKKGSSTAEIKYETGPMYLFAPFVTAKLAGLDMSIANNKWIENPVDNYIVNATTPEVIGKDGLNTIYKTTFGNLQEKESYCGVPTFKIFGMSYFGNPIPLLENQAKRLALIGPAFGANFEYEQPSLALGYDSEGHVKKVIDKINQMESYITRNPLVITQHEYEFDYETGQKVYDSPLYITNIVLDKKSGVITSCHWYDGIGNMKFYYDDQYHLTGMAGGGIFIKLDWDSNGDLKTITSSEDGFTDVIVQY